MPEQRECCVRGVRPWSQPMRIGARTGCSFGIVSCLVLTNCGSKAEAAAVLEGEAPAEVEAAGEEAAAEVGLHLWQELSPCHCGGDHHCDCNRDCNRDHRCNGNRKPCT